MALPISLVASGATNATDVVSKPAGGWLQGNLLVAFVVAGGGSTVPSAPAGWTLVGTVQSGETNFAACAQSLAAAGPSSFSFPQVSGSTYTYVTVVEYSGTAASLVDTFATNSGDSTAPSWSSVTPSVPNEIIVLGQAGSYIGLSGAPAGYTLEHNNSYFGKIGTGVCDAQVAPPSPPRRR